MFWKLIHSKINKAVYGAVAGAAAWAALHGFAPAADPAWVEALQVVITGAVVWAVPNRA